LIKCTHNVIATSPSSRDSSTRFLLERNRPHFVHDSLGLIQGYRSVFARIYRIPCRRWSAWIHDFSRRGNEIRSTLPSLQFLICLFVSIAGIIRALRMQSKIMYRVLQ